MTEETLGFTVLYVTAVAVVFVIVLDFHHGYWIDSASRILKRSKGSVLTALRLVQSFFVMLLSFQAIGVLLGDSLGSTMVSITASTACAMAVMLVMLKRDRGLNCMMVIGLQEAKEYLAGAVGAQLDSRLAYLREGQDRLLAAQEKAVQAVAGREARALLDETKRRFGELGLVTARLSEALLRLSEKEEALDLLRSELELQRDALTNNPQETPGEQAGGRLTAEDGRANRLKGLEAQKELADVVRGWGLAVRVGYGKGVPDFKVMKDDELVAVMACKAFTLCEGGTKQRRVCKADIIAELKYARSKEVPLVIAVKNMITGRWWMHWMSAEEQKEFDGISTPVILAEDGGEAVNILSESVKGVREKLLGSA